MLYLAGRKFGSTGSPELTWAMNTLVPAIVAERFRNSRIVAFSTGNVYPFRDPCGGRLTRDRSAWRRWASTRNPAWGASACSSISPPRTALRCLLFRLNYAMDLRYGVLLDIARKVLDAASR